MIKKLIKNKSLFLFIFSFIFSFLLYYIMEAVYCDEIWTYGFSYNISKGMTIYKDFDVLQMPLYFFITSIFIKIFGHYLIVMHIFDSIIFATMIVLLSKIINWKVIILLPIFIFWWPSGYNLLSLLILIIIIYLINKNKDEDWLIALLVGICFITKQNIGILLFIPCFFYSKHKIKSIIIFLIPFTLVSIYMLWNGAFYNFIDHCFLGMLEFGEKSSYYDLTFLILTFLIVIILMIYLIKSKFKNKEIFYILGFQLISYPIFDIRHFFCALFPIVYLLLKNINRKYILLLISIFVNSFFITLLFSFNFSINMKKDMLFLRNSSDLNILAKEVIDYVDNNENFFFNGYYSYFVKLYLEIPISQYDLLLSGNVGYKGMEKKLKELDTLCSKEKCYFFTESLPKNSILGTQYYDFYNYIVNNYKKIDELFEFDVYISK